MSNLPQPPEYPAHPARSIEYAMARLGLRSRQSIYKLAKNGELKISKVLGRTVIFDEDLEACVALRRGAV